MCLAFVMCASQSSAEESDGIIPFQRSRRKIKEIQTCFKFFKERGGGRGASLQGLTNQRIPVEVVLELLAVAVQVL